MTSAPSAGPASPDDSVEMTFGGNATMLLRIGPFTLLTDPNFLRRGQRAYLGKGLWTTRLTDPALLPDQLPDLDGVVLSHLHDDHWDRIATRSLDPAVPVVTTPAAARELAGRGFSATSDLQPWQTHTFTRGTSSLRVTAVPGVHGPGPLAQLLPPVMGSVLELVRDAGDGAEVRWRGYISGDTLFRPFLADVLERCGPLDVAIPHLGGTRALGVTVTMDARQGADLVELLRPALTVPVHFDDYSRFASPLGDFVAEVADRRLPGTLRPVRRGETISLRA
ncbi:metal-dependent hydrolase [Modestobacter sp. I12A-02628]|uniref:Metal-dependent hydrolase n=1 Tax=Goekera deserti TaxID=2497753 RepID=A0A7K3WA83_9ACTN|nr:MBL fold metallo-hydrolase [Goekera deserti]MPQ98930.1 metal-dependent hydrolase [Goekera deserti]NDI49571.1 metal-dependent hydrolase [Goekera deserti]NEL53236.1 metal-dependent hydrolase [Goekera deserti]